MSLKLVRPQILANQIAVVDGISHSGKSLIAPLISTFRRSELWRIDHRIDCFCVLDSFKNIERDAGRALMRLFADYDLYNGLVGRHINMRPSDISGVTTNLFESKCRRRLCLPDGDGVVKHIKKTRPILVLMTHFMYSQSDLLFDAWSDRSLQYVVTLRHPATLIQDWFRGSWDQRMGKDPREFHLSCKSGPHHVPWFAANWAGLYARSNSLERSVYYVWHFMKDYNDKLKTMPPSWRRRIFWIPYEDFVVNPAVYLRKLSSFMKTAPTSLTATMLRRLRLPRTPAGPKVRSDQEALAKLFALHRVSRHARRCYDKIESLYETKLKNFRGGSCEPE